MSMRGVHTIVPTPFTENGALDEASVRRLVDFLLKAGVDGLAILGFMGEVQKLTGEERRRVIRSTVAEASGRVSTFVGVRAFGTMGAIEQAREAQDLGADGVFVAPIAVQDDSVLFQHYCEVAKAIDIPVIVHDFPEEFGTRLSEDLLARLSTAPDGVRVIKLEEPPVGQKVSRLLQLSGGAMTVLGGLGGVHFLEELQRGASGTMTGFAFPEVLVAIYEAFTEGKTQKAEQLFDRFCPLLSYEFQPKIGLALRKYVYQRRGAIDTAFVRSPGKRLDEPTKAEMDRVIARVGLTYAGPGTLDLS